MTKEEVKQRIEKYSEDHLLTPEGKRLIEYGYGLAKEENQTLRDKITNHITEIVHLNEEIQELKDDLLDALDLKEGRGPTALTMLKSEIARLTAQNQEMREWLMNLLNDIKEGGDEGAIRFISRMIQEIYSILNDK